MKFCATARTAMNITSASATTSSISARPPRPIPPPRGGATVCHGSYSSIPPCDRPYDIVGVGSSSGSAAGSSGEVGGVN